jgi:hypothetical protein
MRKVLSLAFCVVLLLASCVTTGTNKQEYKGITKDFGEGYKLSMIVPNETPNFFEEPYVHEQTMPLAENYYLMSFRNAGDFEDCYVIGMIESEEGKLGVVAYLEGKTNQWYIYVEHDGLPIETDEAGFTEHSDKILKSQAEGWDI